MQDLRVSRRHILKAAGAAGALGAFASPTAAFADGGDEDHHRRVRWDLVLIGSGFVSPGGTASAHAAGGSTITLTGSGTFPDLQNRSSGDVTGGGTWSIVSAAPADPRCFSGHGNYRVVELLSWVPTEGKVALTGLGDRIADPNSSSSGLVKLRVKYDNGRQGVLTVSCDLPPAPNCLFEGITASMDYEDFYNSVVAVPGVDANRTAFHFVQKPE
jgi:hypothetical protein